MSTGASANSFRLLSRTITRYGIFCLLALSSSGVTSSVAHADSLDSNSASENAGYVALEELSHEVIFHASNGMKATLELRVALRNSSRRPYDGLLRMILPRQAILREVKAAYGGVWLNGHDVGVAENPAAGGNGLSVQARTIDENDEVPFPVAEVVVRQAPAGEVVQIALTFEIFPELHLDRWQVTLPSREIKVPHLQASRRILVKNEQALEHFWLDDQANQGAAFLESSANIPVTVAWPAHGRRGQGLAAQAEIIERNGHAPRLRISARMGQERAFKPDHVAVLIDHSRSTQSTHTSDALLALEKLSAALPAGTTIDLIAFARTPRPMLVDSSSGEPAFLAAHSDLQASLAQIRATWPARESGSDVLRALRLAQARAANRKAKRPAILVFTDAMLARQAGREWPAKRASDPPIYVVVDDPLVALLGFDPHQPTMSLATAIGAHVSIEGLADLAQKPDLAERIFASPPVLHELAIEGLPAAAIQHAPDGLIGGQVVHVETNSLPKGTIRLRGRVGTKKLSTGPIRAVRERIAPAFSLAFAGDAPPEYALPTWALRTLIRQSDAGIIRAATRTFSMSGNLDEDLFLQQLRLHVLPRARACYNNALQRHPDFRGEALLHFEVGVGELAYARVEQATLSHRELEFVACLREAAWELDMPAASLDIGVYEARYPLRFVPPTDTRSSAVPKDLQPLFERIMAGPRGDNEAATASR